MSPQEAEGLSEEKLAEVLAEAVKSKQPALAEALAKSKNKSVARAAKKALYQLKSSGVAVAAPEAPKGEQPKVSVQGEELPALMSAIAGTGERALFLAKVRPTGGVDTYQAIVHDEAGILELTRGETSRGKYKKHLEQLRGEKAAVIETTTARALEELGVAWAVSARAKNPLPPEADTHLRRLGVAAVDAWPDLPKPEEGDAALVTRAGSLHDERELQSWLPGDKAIQLLSARLDEVDNSPLQLSEPQKHEQRLSKVAITAAETSADERRIWAHRLWRQAELLDATGRGDKAKIARAEARLLFHDAKARSAFIEKMYEKVVLLAERARAEQLAAAGGQPRPPPEQPKSGLIIP